jgi:hypothetical protein
MATLSQLQDNVNAYTENVTQATNTLQVAQTNLNTIVADPNSTIAQKSTAQIAVGDAQTELNDNQHNLNIAQGELDAAQASSNQPLPVQTTAPQSIISDNSIPTPALKAAEGRDKQAETGNGAIFTNSDANSTNIVNTQTGTVSVVDTTTGVVVGSAGTTPTGTQPANTVPVSSVPLSTNERKVIITGNPTTGGGDVVIFDAMPQIQEQGSANYESFTPIQHPGEILKYKGSSARSWNITAHFISRTSAEATRNIYMLNLIRSWRMPYYGQGTATNPATQQFLGAPPPILTLSAYGDSMVGPVKCVLENYGTDFPNDVDYIPAIDGTPFPVIMNITVTLKESWSPAEYSGFDLQSYRLGDMKAAFTKRAPSPQLLSNQTPAQTAMTLPTFSAAEPVNLNQFQVNAAGPITMPTSLAAKQSFGQGDTQLLNSKAIQNSLADVSSYGSSAPEPSLTDQLGPLQGP